MLGASKGKPERVKQNRPARSARVEELADRLDGFSRRIDYSSVDFVHRHHGRR
jgi:hypothetical protein